MIIFVFLVLTVRIFRCWSKITSPSQFVVVNETQSKPSFARGLRHFNPIPLQPACLVHEIDYEDIILFHASLQQRVKLKTNLPKDVMKLQCNKSKMEFQGWQKILFIYFFFIKKPT